MSSFVDVVVFAVVLFVVFASETAVVFVNVAVVAVEMVHAVVQIVIL